MAYAVKLLVTGALIAFLQGLYCNNEMYDYKVHRDNLTYTEADHLCQGKGRRLAQIDDVSKLNYSQSKSSRYKGQKFWMGLKVDRGRWRWSTGVKPKLSAGFQKIVNNSAQEISINKNDVYCFLVTNDDRLQMENCTLKHPYICGLYTGLLTTPSLPTATSVSSDAAAPIKSTITNTVIFTSQGTYIATEKTILTATAEIMPTRTFIMTSHVTSISPTSFVSPETQIKEYFSKIHKLSVVDEDSLQIAVNETSVLLTRLHDTSYHKTVPNVLPAAQQLEKFAAEYATIHLNTNGTPNSTKTYKGKNFEVMVRKINVGHKKDVIVPSDGKLLLSYTKDKIILPAELFKTKETVVVSIVYKDIHLLLPDESQAFLDGKKLENAKLQTRVIGCYVEPRPLVVLEKNITIIFTLNQPSKAEDRPYCVFWNFHEKSRFNGSWSSKGCSLVNSTDAKVVCTCNHLTNFAVLMQIGDTKIPAKHQVALEFITYIGCGLSLFGEVLTVIVYLVFMNFKQEQCQIRLNLVISIAVAQIIFLAGIDATARQGACIFVAVSIHYFYLAGFAWMLIEGIYLYLMVVKVFNTLVKMKLFYAVSWGFPCIMVVLSLVIASGTDDGITSYVHSDFCWVSFSNNLVWTFAVPVLLVSLINSVVLCRVVCELTKMQGAKDISNIKQGLKACVVLFPLLGMTWVFGVLSVTDAGLVFQYIFTILNSLQGFFIFVMHVLRSSEVRAAYLRKKEKWNTTKNSNFPSSRSAIDASADFSEKHAMRPIRGSTESTDPLSRRHQVSPMNSDIMNTRESCLTPVDS